MNGFYDTINGYIERKASGQIEGNLRIEGIDLSPICAQYFKESQDTYLWIKRKPILEYCDKKQSYEKRERKPLWEAYLKKSVDDNSIAYKGTFAFMHFKFSIVGIWDSVLGLDSKQRLNLFVERLPNSQQTIINGINERKRNGGTK